MQNPMVVFTFDPKNEDCQFKLKFGTLNYSNMQSLMAMFTLPALDRKYPFGVNLAQNVKNVSLS